MKHDRDRRNSFSGYSQPVMRAIILTSLLIISLTVAAQKQGNIWYFGDHAGLDFNSGSPVFINNGQINFPDGTHNEGTASICDSSGNLLFYTNGKTIWDQNHLIMPNGNGLSGNWSSTQAALILPQPGSSRYFYVFTTDGFYNSNMDKGLRYSIVDMCLNNGTGGVMFWQKNILLLDTVAEKLTAVRHDNGTDYWVITHKYYSDAFYSFQLSASGIVDTVISHIGSFHPTGLQYPVAAIGQLKASPDGHKLAIANGNSNNCIAEYFDFDPATGIVSNVVNLQWDVNNQFYGVSFSPDNTKLYFACNFNSNGIYQFDLTAGGGDPDSVRASRTSIADSTNAFLALQLGPDGKIYVTHTPVTNVYLGVINNPNASGTACNYIDNFVDLNGHEASYGLPNFVDSYDYSNKIDDCQTMGVDDQDNAISVTVFPNPVSGDATLQLNKNLSNAICTLTNSLGQCVKEMTGVEGSTIGLSRAALPSGIYYLQIMEDGEIITTIRIQFE